MTIHRPGTKVREWLEAGVLAPTDPESKLERLLDEAGQHDVSYRHEALTALRIQRYEHETGDPF